MEPYLYLLMRNDLPSMNPGKAVAQGAHAANKAVLMIRKSFKTTSEIGRLLTEWEESTDQGFGTTITLSASLPEIETAVKFAPVLGSAISADISIDPTYPYIVDSEMAKLIDHPEGHPPVRMRDGRYVCFREEITAGYVFGRKSDLVPLLGKFPLMD